MKKINIAEIETITIYIKAGLSWFIPYTAKVLVINTNTAIGLNLDIIKFKKTEIILLISISKFFKTNILSPTELIHKPTTMAKNTIANTILLFDKVAEMLFGIIFIITNNGLVLTLVVTDEAIYVSISTLNTPSL